MSDVVAICVFVIVICRGLTQTTRPAGATTGLSCSLCKAGTYQTGSGQGGLGTFAKKQSFLAALSDVAAIMPLW